MSAYGLPRFSPCVWLASVLWFWTPSSPAYAQSMLGGVVRLPDGKVASGVELRAINEDTKQQYDARSNNIGLFAFYHLSPGVYTITATLGDLVYIERGVRVRQREKRALDLNLRIGRNESITVGGDAPVSTVFAPDGSLGARTSRQQLEAMPLPNGRTLQSILSAIPGIVFTDSVGTLATFTTSGQGRFENRLNIDGIGADLAIDLGGLGGGQAESGALPATAVSGGTQVIVPLAAIEEIQVRTTNAPPEVARAPGAQTTIVTRAGTEQLKGSGFLNVRPDSLAASDWFSNAGRRPERKAQYRDAGVALGGPFMPGRAYYFGAVEWQDIDRPVHTTISVPSVAVRQAAAAPMRAVIDAYPLPNGSELNNGLAEYTAWFPSPSHLWSGSVRLDANLTTRHRLFVRGNRGESEGDGLGQDLLPPFTFSYRERTTTETGTIGLTSALSSRMANDMRAAISAHRGSLRASPAPYGGAQPLPMDILAPGASENAWIAVSVVPNPRALMFGQTTATSQRQIQIADTFTFATRRHQWRFGFDVMRATATSIPAPERYTYQFLNLTDPRVRVIVERLAPVTSRRDSWSLFAQDTFRLLPRFSVNYGVRIDIQPAPRSVGAAQPTLLNYAQLPLIEPRILTRSDSWWKTARTMGPQIAASFVVGTPKGHESSLHAGWSGTHAPLTNPGTRPFRGAPYLSSRTTPIVAFPVAQSILSSPTTQWDYYAVAENLRPPSVRTWYVGLEQSMPGKQQVSLSYVGSAGRGLIYWHSYDVGASRIHAFSNAGTSDYHAMVLHYVRRMSRQWQAELSYTWSHAMDTDSGEPRGPLPPPNVLSPEANRGSADFDRRHMLHGFASYRPSVSARTPSSLRAVLTDWQIDIVANVLSSAQRSPESLRSLETGVYWLRTDYAPEAPIWRDEPDAPRDRALNRDAFPVPRDRRQGTLGRNAIKAFPLAQIDLSIVRTFRARSRATIQFRLDAFNVFNLPNFGPPETRVGQPRFGQPLRSYADALGTGSLTHGGLTPLQQLGGPRSLQIGLRLGL